MATFQPMSSAPQNQQQQMQQQQHMMNNSRSQTISYADLMKPDEDWRMLPDAAERRKIQNRLAQRAYRRNMRDRTKELEKLKKELAKLKENKEPGPVRLTPRMPSPPMQRPQPQPLQQQRPMPVMATPEDFLFDGTMQDANMAMGSSQWATEPFPQAQFNDQGLHIDPSFFITGTDASDPPLKRRRTNSSASEMMTPSRSNSTLSVFNGFRQGHQRSRSHTPLSSPPMVHPATPPPATMAEIQQASQLLFDMGNPSDSMGLPQMAADSPPFALDGFTDNVCGSNQVNSFDQSLWTPPMPSANSIYGSFLTPPTTDGAASPPSWQSTPGSIRSEAMGRSRSASASTVSRSSPFSSATSQFSNGSPALKTAHLQPVGLDLNLDGSCGDKYTTNEAAAGNMGAAPTQTNSTLLHLAVAGGHTQVLQLLLQRCEVPINARDSAGYTALQRAVFAGRMEMVTMLLEAGADFSAGRQDDGAACEATMGSNCNSEAAVDNGNATLEAATAAPAS